MFFIDARVFLRNNDQRRISPVEPLRNVDIVVTNAAGKLTYYAAIPIFPLPPFESWIRILNISDGSFFRMFMRGSAFHNSVGLYGFRYLGWVFVVDVTKGEA